MNIFQDKLNLKCGSELFQFFFKKSCIILIYKYYSEQIYAIWES